ncbi:MAG TPA: adenosylcobinamide-phosphate synthase CbiB [Verrucomicrobiae bacterium]|nr:adenosylcobinamide-phosphate synthase CbiB [Verrucomicrobiae bacterium]
MNEIIILLPALLLDLLLGDPQHIPHPVRGVGKLVELLEELLRRYVPGERLAGILLVILTVGGTWSAGYYILKNAYVANPYIGFGVSVYLAWTCLAARSLHAESGRVAAALAAGDLPEARRRLSFIVGRDTENLSEEEVWRAAVETVAENASDGVIAPLFYLMIGGIPLALAYKAVNTLDSMVGYRNERYLRFGWAAARLDDLANWLPARLTGLLMVLGAPLLGLSGGSAWRIMVRDGKNHSSPNSGVPEAAAAGALGVRLGGANSYFGRKVEKPTIGEARRPLDRRAWAGAVRLMYAAEFLLVGGWLALKGVSGA